MDSLNFQAIDWQTVQTTEYVDDYSETKTDIIVFGRTKEDKTVYLEIKDFIFSFYIKNDKKEYEEEIKKCLRIKDYRDYIEYKKIRNHYKDFYYFNGEKPEDFIIISSKNYNKLLNFSKLMNNDYLYIKKKTVEENKILNLKLQQKEKENNKKNKEKEEKKEKKEKLIKIKNKNKFVDTTYNNGKDAITQFFHAKHIKPCGWLKVKNYEEAEISAYNETKADINITANWEDIEDYETDEIVKFKLCAYDIECISEDEDKFPDAKNDNDKIVSIALTISEIGSNEILFKCIIILNEEGKRCPNIEDVKVYNCDTESDLILCFCKVIREQDPDFITGWNNFGFDDKYIKIRAKKLDIKKKINFSRFENITSRFRKNVKLSSGALGDNIFNFYEMKGRVNFDLMKAIQREHRLVSYKLDYVASLFFREEIKNIENNDNITILTLKNVNKTFHNNQYVFILRNENDTDYNYEDTKTRKLKFKVLEINDNIVKIDGFINPEFMKEKGIKFICNAKDDLPAAQIFEKYKKGKPEDLKILSLYNIQDCALCNLLCNKLFILINNIAMANTCYTTSYNIFNRGQGVRVYSIVSKKCLELNYLIPDLKRDKDKDETQTFEGAYVIPPKPGIKPAIFCLDYAALYPRSIICKNISHEMYIKDATDDNIEEYKRQYPDYNFNRIEYNIITEKKKPKTKKDIRFNELVDNYELSNVMDMINIEYKEDDNSKKNKKVCYFAVNKNKEKRGIIPQVASDVLTSRAAVRKEQKKYEPHSFVWEVFEQKQLSYKVVCNSIYGALGASTGKIGLMELAACTTATGQEMLKTAKNFAENILPTIIKLAFEDYDKFYDYLYKLFKSSSDSSYCGANKYFSDSGYLELFEDYVNELFENIIKTFKGYTFKLKVEYGDTDSIFVAANIKKDNKPVYGLKMRELHIKFGQLAESIINNLLPEPENLEYEKILSPFIILSKKRYVGNLYESDPKKFYQKNMGLVLKRRDNAPIVKYVYGGMVDKLLNIDDQKKGQKEALDFIIKSLNRILNNNFKINYFTISKSLKSQYKNPQQIAHYVLAQRITKRDPGNAPRAGDRIDYVYIKKDKAGSKLQGDKIETPEYIKKNKLQIDYQFYIMHQLKEPCVQIMNLFYEKAEELFDDYIKKCGIIQSGYRITTLDEFIKQ